jgi:hypothetical protein
MQLLHGIVRQCELLDSLYFPSVRRWMQLRIIESYFLFCASVHAILVSDAELAICADDDAASAS